VDEKQIRKIIADELDKDVALRTYFDNWGSRAYIFASELDRRFRWSKRDTVEVNELAIDVASLRSLGGEFLQTVDDQNHPGKRETDTSEIQPARVWVTIFR
jgi:hypothetical protein